MDSQVAAGPTYANPASQAHGKQPSASTSDHLLRLVASRALDLTQAPPAIRNAGGAWGKNHRRTADRSKPVAPDVSARVEDNAAQEEHADDQHAEEDAPAPQTRVMMEGPIRAALVELNGREDGRVTPLRLAEGERALIGRMGDDLTLRLSHDQWVSARHAQIWMQDNEWWLEDLKSRNGTQLQRSEEPLAPESPVRLEIGDIFRVGHTDLLLTNDLDVLRPALQQV